MIFNCFFLSFAFSLFPIKSSFSNSSFLWLFVLYLFVLYLLSIYCYIYWICWLVLYLCRDGIIISKYCAVTSKYCAMCLHCLFDLYKFRKCHLIPLIKKKYKGNSNLLWIFQSSYGNNLLNLKLI